MTCCSGCCGSRPGSAVTRSRWSASGTTPSARSDTGWCRPTSTVECAWSVPGSGQAVALAAGDENGVRVPEALDRQQVLAVAPGDETLCSDRVQRLSLLAVGPS